MRRYQIAWRWLAGVLTMAALLLAGGLRVHAQATTATLVGTVTDATGAALGHATVTITDQLCS